MVTSREGRVSRNVDDLVVVAKSKVTSREGRVSRNTDNVFTPEIVKVTSREGRVSRNFPMWTGDQLGGTSRPVRDV